MKILWIDLNSSYAHASLALPAIHAQIKGNPDIEWEIVSCTINEEYRHDRKRTLQNANPILLQRPHGYLIKKYYCILFADLKLYCLIAKSYWRT